MSRKRKSHAIEVKTMEIPPAIRSHSASDAEEERLLTPLLLAGERIGEALRGELPPRPNTTHATPVEKDAGLPIDDLDSLRDFALAAQAWVEADSKRSDLLRQLREAFRDGAILPILFRSLFPRGKPFV